MAVTGEGIERDIAQDADVRHFLLDGADGPAHQIVFVERFAAGLVAQARVGIGEQRDAGDGQLGGALSLAHRLVDGKALDAGHRGDRGPRILPVHDEQRPDQVVGGEDVFLHHAARPLAAPVAPQPGGKVEPVAIGRGAALKRGQVRAGFDRTSEFDGHEEGAPGLLTGPF